MIERMFTEKRGKPCSFPGCEKPIVAKGYCSGHYRQSRKGQPLRPLRPFNGKEEPHGLNGPCRFNDLPEAQSGEWERCSAPRYRTGWCVGMLRSTTGSARSLRYASAEVADTSPIARRPTTVADIARVTTGSCSSGANLSH